MPTTIELTVNEDGTLDLNVETKEQEMQEGESDGVEQQEADGAMHPKDLKDALRKIEQIAGDLMSQSPNGEDAAMAQGFDPEMAAA